MREESSFGNLGGVFLLFKSYQGPFAPMNGAIFYT